MAAHPTVPLVTAPFKRNAHIHAGQGRRRAGPSIPRKVILVKPVTSLVHLLLASRLRRREQWLDPVSLAELRGERLRRLARVAARTPYYRDVFARAGMSPEELTEGTLARLPLLDKAELHAAGPLDMVTEPPGRLSAVTTSGSTGQPLRVFRSTRDQAEVSAVWSRTLEAFGHGFFDRQVNVSTGRAVAKSGPVVMLRKIGLLPEIRHLSSFDAVDHQVETLRRTRPHTFSAYAISLELIAERMLELGITDVRPAVVFSAAMPLSDRGRELAERAFGVRPLDVYVAAELGTLGWECPVNRGALHLNDDVQIIEILDEDGGPVAPGEVGQVVVTQLHTLAQPLLRYRLGDLAARVPGRCGCGRGLALLSPVQGRTRHVIRTPDGRVLYGMMVSTVVKPFTEVRRWQLRQTAENALSLLVVPSERWRPGVGEEIARQLEEKFGPGLRFQVEPVDDIPLAPSGKLQVIVPLEEHGAQQRASGEVGLTSSPTPGYARQSPPAGAGSA
jgi:phenylacetate-CoA ligase